MKLLSYNYSQQEGETNFDTQLEMKWIEGFENIYSIREDGQVRSHDRLVPHGNTNGTRLIKGRWLKTGLNTKGYKMLVLRKDGCNHVRMVHRLVAIAFVKGDNKLTVNHIDCDKLNNVSSNLEWLTIEDNIAHAIANGLYERG